MFYLNFLLKLHGAIVLLLFATLLIVVLVRLGELAGDGVRLCWRYEADTSRAEKRTEACFLVTIR